MSVGFGLAERGGETDAAVAGGSGAGDVLTTGSKQVEEVPQVLQVVQVHDLVPACRSHDSRALERVSAGPRTTTFACASGPARRAGSGSEPWAAVAGRAPKTAGSAKSMTQSRQIWAMEAGHRGVEDGTYALPDLGCVLLLQLRGRAVGPDGRVFEGQQRLGDAQPDQAAAAASVYLRQQAGLAVSAEEAAHPYRVDAPPA